MDIASLSIAMNQSKVQQSAGIALMKMAMNNTSENAGQITEMLENVSSNPNLGNNLDIKA
ncbi:YjfB family protein [Clostridium tyrobutyricum]|uniref:YjfB family protein n=1 Tax=Clostridium tyrobutyricum TaxID=1519 RepID=UPI001C382628|nr:YjfB family protein [Clostridium tyrobutyricum]MBV4419799.1 YjfB family protein [Clostridium tyrobutyricum]